MLALFRKNDITGLLGLCFLVVVTKLYVLTHMPAVHEVEDIFKSTVYHFGGWQNFYTAFPFIYGILSCLVILLMAFYINYTAVSEKLFLKKNYYPALSFLICTSFVPLHSLLGTPLLSAFLSWVAMAKCLSLAQNPQAKKIIFHVGLLGALAMVLYFPSVLFFILLFLLVLFFRPTSLQEIAAYILGYLTPLYIVGIVLYLVGKWNAKGIYFFAHIQLPQRITHPKHAIIVGIVSICILVYGWFQYQQIQNRLHISIRKKWNAIGMFFICSTLCGLFSKYFPGTTWVFIAAPFSILLSMAMQGKKENLNIFTFFFIIISLLLSQWLIK